MFHAAAEAAAPNSCLPQHSPAPPGQVDDRQQPRSAGRPEPAEPGVFRGRAGRNPGGRHHLCPVARWPALPWAGGRGRSLSRTRCGWPGSGLIFHSGRVNQYPSNRLAARQATKSWRGSPPATTPACTRRRDISARCNSRRNGSPGQQPRPHERMPSGDAGQGQGHFAPEQVTKSASKS